MTDATNPIEIRMTKSAKDKHRVDCTLSVPSDADFSIQLPQGAWLVMDPSRPTSIGWRFVPSIPYVFHETLPRDHSQPLILSRAYDGVLTYSFWNRSDWFDTDLFVPPGESNYTTRATFDPETNAIWCPLPYGRSLNLMNEYFGFHEMQLVYFVQDWCSDRDLQSPLPFTADAFLSNDDEAMYVTCDSKTTEQFSWIRIPESLLQDPIRNGSELLDHGFNPWNEDQKGRIVAHLETEIDRLTDLFKRDAVEHSISRSDP